DHVAVYDAEGEWIDTLRQGDYATGSEPAPLAKGLREAATRVGFAVGVAHASGGRTRLPLVRALRAGESVTGYVLSGVDLVAVEERVDFLAETHFPGLPNALFVVDERLRAVARSGSQETALSSMANEAPIAGLDPATLATRFSQSG